MIVSRKLYYWVLHLKAIDGMAVIDHQGKVYYLSIGKWNTLVDLVKKDFKHAKERVQLLPGTSMNLSKAVFNTKLVLEQMLEQPQEIDKLRSTIRYEIIFGTSLQRKVWKYLIEKVPVLKTISYSMIAAALDIKSARVVGNACGANRIALLIPCHRVLTAQGKINGYRWGTDVKERLLQLERKKMT